MSARSRRQTLGQHFLGDVGVARAIVDTIAPRSTDLVVEIGPGRGVLTGELARRAGQLIALEIDSTLVPALRTRFPSVMVVQADARSWPYSSLVRPPGGRVVVVGTRGLVATCDHPFKFRAALRNWRPADFLPAGRPPLVIQAPRHDARADRQAAR